MCVVILRVELIRSMNLYALSAYMMGAKFIPARVYTHTQYLVSGAQELIGIVYRVRHQNNSFQTGAKYNRCENHDDDYYNFWEKFWFLKSYKKACFEGDFS